MAGEGEGTRRPKTGEGGTSFGWGEAGVSAADVLGHRLKPGLQDLDQMMTVDGWVQAMHGALTWPIRRLTWSVVEAAGDTGEADDVRDQLAPLLPRIVAGSSQGIGHGVAFAEIVWQDDGAGGLYIDDVAFRPISTCKPERRRSGRVLGFKQVAHTPDFSGAINETFLVSERKAFVYAHDSTTNPGIGRSAFETAYQYYKDKRKILFYRFKNLEKFGGASIHGKMENASNPELRRQFESAMAELRNGGVAVTGLKDEVALLQSPNAGVAFRQAITDQNFEMAVSALVQWLAYAQEGNSGSRPGRRGAHRRGRGRRRGPEKGGQGRRREVPVLGAPARLDARAPAGGLRPADGPREARGGGREHARRGRVRRARKHRPAIREDGRDDRV